MIVLSIALPKLLDQNNAKNIKEICVSSSVADPWHFGTDPLIRIHGSVSRTKKLDLDPDLTPDYYFLKVHFHYFLKMKGIKKSRSHKTVGIKVFLTLYFCLMIKGSRSGAVSGSFSLINGSGSISGRPKTDPAYLDPAPQHWSVVIENKVLDREAVEWRWCNLYKSRQWITTN